MAQWFIVFATLILAIVAVFQDKIRARVTRPKLRAEIFLAPPDCHRTLISDRREQNIGNCFYFRLRVYNNGNTAAKTVEVFASSLKRKCADGIFRNVDSFLPMNFTWSHIGGLYFPSISPNMYKHCDLGHIVAPNIRHLAPGESNDKIVTGTQTIFSFDQIVKPNNKGYLIGPGKYALEIVVAAANASPKVQQIEINHTGKWYTDEDEMLKDGIDIKCL